MREQAYFAHDEVIQAEAARLLGDVFALYEFETYRIFDGPRDTFFDLASFVDERIGRALLTLASLARVNDDGGGGLALHATRKKHGVGTLNEGKGDSILTAREACNKILHAKQQSLTLNKMRSHPVYQEALSRDYPRMPRRRYLRPHLSLIASRTDGTEWHAVVDLVQWVHAVLNFSTAYAKPVVAAGPKRVPRPNVTSVARRAAKARVKGPNKK